MSYFNKGTVIGVGILLPMLSSAAVTMRFAARKVRKQQLWFDDFLSILAWYLVTGCALSLIVGAFGNVVGAHSTSQDVVPGPKTRQLGQIEFAFNLMFTLGLGMIKLIPLFFYRRVFSGRLFNVLNWSLTALVISWTVSFFFANILGCGNNISFYWSPSAEASATCIDMQSKSLASAATDALIDMCIALLPLGFIKSEQLAKASKFSIAFAFILGTFTVACSLTSLAFQSQLRAASSNGDRVFGLQTDDTLGIKGLYLYWQMVELGVAMIVCCLPVPILRPDAIQRAINKAKFSDKSGSLVWTRRRERSDSMDSWPGAEETYFTGPYKVDTTPRMYTDKVDV